MDFQYITAINSELLNRKILNNCIENNENIIIKVIKTENRDNYNESEDKDSHKDIETTDNFEKQSNHSIIDNLGEKCKDLMPSNDKNDNNISLNNKSENSSLLRLLLLNKTESRDKFEDQFCEELNERQISFETIYKTESNDSEDNDNTFNDEYMDSFEMGFHLRHKYNNETQSHKNISNNNLNTNEFKCDINDCKYTTHNDKCLKVHKTEAHIKPYFCKLCDNKFGKKISLINHMKKEHKDNIVICGHNGCERRYLGLRSLEALHRHQMSKHPELFPNNKLNTNEFKCDINDCKYTTFNKRYFSDHKSVVHLKPNICQLCDTKFGRNVYLRKHMINEHKDVKPFICNEDNCNESFYTSFDLQIHKRIHKNIVICVHNGCESRFTGLRALEYFRRHNLSKHPEVVSPLNSQKSKPLIAVCGYNGCEMSYKSLRCFDVLRVHQIRKHPEMFPHLKTLVCDKNGCEFSTKSKRLFDYHMEGHEEMRRYICEVKDCGKAYVREQQLKDHMKTHSRVRQRHVCDWKDCNQSFVSSDGLYKHKLRHKGIKKYVCVWNNCGKKFFVKTHLENHMNGHTGHKPHLCSWPECGKKFRTATLLFFHMKHHINDKRYVCDWPECHYKTCNKSNLNKHKCIHTGEKRFVCDWPQCHYKCTIKCHLKTHQNKHIRQS